MIGLAYQNDIILDQNFIVFHDAEIDNKVQRGDADESLFFISNFLLFFLFLKLETVQGNQRGVRSAVR